MSAAPVLRTKAPKICFANLGPRYVLPIPAPSGRPLTKGAFLHQLHFSTTGFAA